MALTDGLISYWKLDEASGTRNDSHGSNHLTDNNTVASATGIINSAADFEADNSEYLSHTDNTDLSTGDIDFSLSFWVKAETLSGFPVPICKGDNGDREYILYFSSGVPQWEVNGSTVSWGAALSTGTWYHIVVWHDSVSNLVGIAVNNGTPVTASDGSGGRDTIRDFWIGTSLNQSLYWDGLIDEVGFWKKVLSSGEITSLYGGGAGLAYPLSGGGGGGVHPYWIGMQPNMTI